MRDVRRLEALINKNGHRTFKVTLQKMKDHL
jgi:hypothetical protein